MTSSWAQSLLQPRVILPALAVVLIAALMLTPEVANTDLDQRLTTHSTNPSGASGIYEVASRFGWHVKRQETPITAPLDTTAVYAVLAPVEPLGDIEAHTILDAVRRGAGLIFVVDSGEVLSDSLGLRHTLFGWPVSVGPTDSVGCGRLPALPALPNLTYGRLQIPNVMYGPLRAYLLRHGKGLTDDMVPFIAVYNPKRVGRPSLPVEPDRDSAGAEGTTDVVQARDEEFAPAVLGIPFGRGRIVAVSDRDFLRNDVVRICRWNVGPRIITALDWVSRGRQPPLIFDEYHQGFGPRPSVFNTSKHFLASTAVGHTILQALLAGALLIIALGVRPILPRTTSRIERRSPLEHVDALARAYDQVGATRTATRRLVRGLRRRHDRGSWSIRVRAASPPNSDADERFLGNVAAAHPEVRPAAAVILAAERSAHPETKLVSVADAVDQIDDVFPTRDVPSGSTLPPTP